MARLQLKSLAIIVAITVVACLVLGFVLPGFRNPAAIFLACVAAVCAYGAPRDWWRAPDFLVLLGLVAAIGLVLFVVSPSVISR